MVRRVNVPSSSRLFLAVFSLAACAVLAHGQSALERSGSGSTFVVAPTVSLAAAPTSVALGDLKGDGRSDLILTTRGSDKLTVLLGDGKGGFAPDVEYAAGARPGIVLLADLTGSGKLDAIVTDIASGTIDVLRGKGDGTFQKAESFKAIANPVALALGAFGGGGKTDVAVASAKGIAVLLNDGTGHFTPGSPIALTHALRSLAAADLRRTGHDDLVAANGDGTVTVLKGDGAGAFNAMEAVKVASGAVAAIASGDFNRDGKADLALVETDSNKIAILLGRGDGSFEKGVSYAVGNGPVSILVNDLKGDGGTDLVTANAAANTFSVLIGRGDGTFKPAVDFAAGNSPLAIAAGDFNDDGHADLAILNAGDRSVSLPLGHGDGTFHAAASYRTGLEQKAIASGDLTGDGLPDLVVTNFCGEDATCKGNGTATVMLASKNGSYRQGATYELGSGPVAVALAALHTKGRLDLVAVNRNDKTLMVLPGKGNGKFGEPEIYTLSVSPRAVFAGDFNADGRPDLAIAGDCGRSTCSEPGSVDIWLSRPNGKLTLDASYTAGYSPISIAAGNLRGAGHLDLLVANSCSESGSCKSHGAATVLACDGKGKFSDGGEIELGSAPSSIAIGKLSGKGLDLVVAERGSDRIAVLHANGKGGFGAPAYYKAGAEPAALAIADFDGDGNLDVAAANFKDSTVSVLRGNSKGSLDPAVNYAVGAGPESIVSIAGAKSGPAGLVTANGNAGSTPMGADVTVLLQVHPDSGPTVTTTTLTESPTTPGLVDQEITLTAVVAGNLTNLPTGTVTFFLTDSGGTVNGTLTCIGPNDNTLTAGTTTSSATCNVFLTAGAYFFQASYDPGTDVHNAASSSVAPSAEYDVDASPTTTTLSTPTGQAADSASVVVTATVAPTTPPASPADVQAITGTGAFSVDGSPFASCGSQGMTFSGATGTAAAKCTIPAGTLSDGLHFISAMFSSGDGNYLTSTGDTFLTVGGTSKTTVTFSATPTVDLPVTITAAVTALSGGSGTPSGTVTFSGSVPGCGSPQSVIVKLNGAGTATCTPSAANFTTVGSPYSVTATYTPDSNSTYLGSNSGAQPLSAAKSGTVATASSTDLSATVDETITLSANIVPAGGATASVPIGGSVTFKNGGTANIPGCTAAIPVVFSSGSATATCTPTTSGLLADTYNVTAVYSGDANYTTITSPAIAEVVSPENTNTTLASATNPSPVGQVVTFTATVAPKAVIAAPVSIGGQVTFTFNSGTAIPGCASPINVTFGAGTGIATAKCTPSSSFFALGSYTITAAYGGDTNYNNSNSTPLTQSVNLAASTTTVGAIANSSVNEPLTISIGATVTPNVASSVPVTGTVSFFDNGVTITGCGSRPVTAGASAGTASCPGYQLVAGSHSVTASYSGNTNYDASPTSAAQTFTVAQSNVSIAMSVNTASPSAVNAGVTLFANVAPSPRPNPITNLVPFTSAGTVTFLDTATPISDCSNVGVVVQASTATATCVTHTLVAGPHNINANFSGDINYNAGSSATAAAHTEAANGTTTALSSSLNPAALSQQVIFTAAVTPNSGPNPPGVAPAGTVTFKDGSTVICAASALNGTGTATCSTSTLIAGFHTITAVFNSSDGNYTSSPTATLSPQEQIVQNLTQTALTTSPNGSSHVNQQVTLTDTVTESGSTPPTGTVAFTVNGNLIPGCGAVAVSKNAPFTAGCATPGIAVLGTAGAGNTITYQANALKATYSGDSNYGSGIATTTLTVSPQAATVTTVTSTPANTAVVNQSGGVTLTANVYWNSTSSVIPAGGVPMTGSLQFLDGATPVTGCNTITVNSGTGGFFTASCTTNQLVAGAHSITAAFTTNSLNYAGSTSTALPLTVTPGTTRVSVVSSLSPSAVNQQVTFTATVSFDIGGVPLNGTVTFTVGGQPLSQSNTGTKNCTDLPITQTGLGTVTATCPTTSLSQGNHTIAAVFNPATSPVKNFNSSTGTFSQAVQGAFTKTVLSSLKPSVVDGSVMLTATVSSAFPNGKTLSGSIDFEFANKPVVGVNSTGSTISCKAVPVVAIANSTSVTATCTTKSLTAGTDTISATFNSATTNFAGSSDSKSITVAKATLGGATLNTSEATILSGGSVTFTAKIAAPANTTPTIGTLPVPIQGTVEFLYDGFIPIPGCETRPLSSAGTATCTSKALPDGALAIGATFDGDPNYNSISANLLGTTGKAEKEIVQDFSLSIAANPPVIVSHGFTTITDPVAPNTITVTPVPIQGYTGTIVVSCNQAISVATVKGFAAPLCQFPNGNTITVQPGGAQESKHIVINAGAATPGTYQIQVTGASTAGNLKFTTPTANALTIYVSSTASLAKAALTSIDSSQATVDFVLPAGVSLTPATGGNWCESVTGPALASPVSPATLSISCSASESSIPASATTMETPITIKVSTKSTPPGSYYLVLEGLGKQGTQPPVPYFALIKLVVKLT